MYFRENGFGSGFSIQLCVDYQSNYKAVTGFLNTPLIDDNTMNIEFHFERVTNTIFPKGFFPENFEWIYHNLL